MVLGVLIRVKNYVDSLKWNRYHVTIAALKSLADKGEFEAAKIDEAIKKYNIDAEIIAPWLI